MFQVEVKWWKYILKIISETLKDSYCRQHTPSDIIYDVHIYEPCVCI